MKVVWAVGLSGNRLVVLVVSRLLLCHSFHEMCQVYGCSKQTEFIITYIL